MHTGWSAVFKRLLRLQELKGKHSMAVMFASYGAGTNSTAMLIKAVEHKMPVDLILFADTGGERPDTYAYRDLFSEWMESHGYPAIITVRESVTLEADCLRRKALPAIAYGFKTCSQRWKNRPQERFIKNWHRAQEAWRKGEKVIKLVGFDADEPHRANRASDEGYQNRYPLIEWKMGREECIAAIQAAGLPLPGKSSCFYCPNMEDHEIRDLMLRYPDLAERARQMELNAELTDIKGLGRSFAWRHLMDFYDRQAEFDFSTVINREQCGECHDG
jgi:hypothetical protein